MHCSWVPAFREVRRFQLGGRSCAISFGGLQPWRGSIPNRIPQHGTWLPTGNPLNTRRYLNGSPATAERQSLLRGYFEASDEERAEGIKGPTAAHRAIADLVASGSIRVIVTTNFDRLLESALESAGVSPLVIATTDQAVGAPPLAHNACTIIKVHGDYLDTRTRNSDAELALYDPAIDALLDQVFDEYGLIVCGWSGEYDIALRAAMERCPSRRYTDVLVRPWCHEFGGRWADCSPSGPSDRDRGRRLFLHSTA